MKISIFGILVCVTKSLSNTVPVLEGYMQVSLLSPDGLTERCLATFAHVIFTFFGETSTTLKLCMTSLSQFHI